MITNSILSFNESFRGKIRQKTTSFTPTASKQSLQHKLTEVGTNLYTWCFLQLWCKHNTQENTLIHAPRQEHFNQFKLFVFVSPVWSAAWSLLSMCNSSGIRKWDVSLLLLSAQGKTTNYKQCVQFKQDEHLLEVENNDSPMLSQFMSEFLQRNNHVETLCCMSSISHRS